MYVFERADGGMTVRFGTALRRNDREDERVRGVIDREEVPETALFLEASATENALRCHVLGLNPCLHT